MQPTTKKVIGGIVVIVVAGVALARLNTPSNNEVATPTNTNIDTTSENATTSSAVSTTTTTTTTTPPPQRTYKDGTYNTIGSYRSPAGTDTFGLTITIKDDKVVSTSFDIQAKPEASKRYQQGFAEEYRTQVVGKSVDSINLSIVSGASLTTKSFMDALVTIKAEAKA